MASLHLNGIGKLALGNSILEKAVRPNILGFSAFKQNGSGRKTWETHFVVKMHRAGTQGGSVTFAPFVGICLYSLGR